jgi:GTP-binding protein
MLIDIRIPPQKIDLEWMEWLTNNNIYFIRIFTKSDSLRKSNINKAISQYNKVMSTKWEKIPETLITSSKNKDGRNNVLNKIIELNKLFQNI